MRTLLVACTFTLSAAYAQTSDLPANEAVQAQFEAAQAQAAADATRPGDADLTCEQLQAEVVANAQSPEMQAAIHELGAFAQADLEKLNEAQEQAEQQAQAARRGVFRSMAQGLASAAVPNNVGGAAQQAAAAAQAAQQRAEAMQRQQALLSQAPHLAATAGPAMRGMRVMELAQARNCEWLQIAPPSTPGAAPPQGP